MAKAKRIGKKPSKFPRSRREVSASDEPDLTSNPTLDPDFSSYGTVDDWFGPDSTSAPAVGEEEAEKPYATGGWGLLESFLQGRVLFRPKSVFLLLTLGWFGFISWLFKTDNELGRLDASAGMWWFWEKAIIYTGYYLVVSLIVGVYWLISRRAKS